jgi:hypothetical protein
MRQFIDTPIVRRPDAIERAFAEVPEEATRNHAVVVPDDLYLITDTTDGYKYGRAGLLSAALEAVPASAAMEGRKVKKGPRGVITARPLLSAFQVAWNTLPCRRRMNPVALQLFISIALPIMITFVATIRVAQVGTE